MEKNYFSEKESNPPSLRLFVFFSKNNCASCLEIIDALNELPSSYFKVVGVVPDNESKNIKEIRSLTGAIFPIEGQSKFKNFLPRYMPSIVGVTRKNEIFFILPGVPGEKDYLFKFLDEIYNRIYNYHTN